MLPERRGRKDREKQKKMEELWLGAPYGLTKRIEEQPALPKEAEKEQQQNEEEMIHLAAATNDIEAINSLLAAHNQKTVVDARDIWGATPLHYAARNGHCKTIRFLVANGADVAAKTTNMGMTALHSAAANGHARAVKTLLLCKANQKIKSWRGSTALHLAAQKGFANVLSVMLRLQPRRTRRLKNAARMEDGETPLISAAQNNHAEAVRVLCEAGVDLEGTLGGGKMTALHAAARYGCLEAAKVLVDFGADWNKRSAFGRIPRDIAFVRGHFAVADLLDELTI